MAKVHLTDADTAKVADLIKIAIPQAELAKYTTQLNTALDSTSILAELDTSNTPVSSQTHGLKNVLRTDVAQPGLDIEKYPNRRNLKKRYFVVKKVIS